MQLKRLSPYPTRFYRSKGSMLVEVLVSLLLLSLGVGAWLSAQAGALQQSRLNQNLGLATVLAADLGERLRLAPAHAAVMAAQLALPVSVGVGSAACTPSTCDAAAWARADVAHWRLALQLALPQPSALLLLDADGRSGTLTLAWREPGTRELSERSSAYLRCPVGQSFTDDLWRCLNVGLAW